MCNLPLGCIYVDADGSRRICCVSQDKPSYESIGKITNASKRVHLQMMRGIRPEECSICWSAENSGMKSVRQGLANINNNTVNTVKPYFYDIRFGRTCNLACKMCKPYYSSKWADLERRIIKQYQIHKI